MYKRITAIVISICILLEIIPQSVYAANNDLSLYIDKSQASISVNGINATSATSIVNTRTVNDVIAQHKFTWVAGHSFAAEQGNNYIDKIKGKNTRVVGDNNVKNGPDRQIINRDGSITFIQDKYYSNPRTGIDACFENGSFRYITADGSPMQIEVPKDQYNEAVALMEEKIRQNKVPGVTDPNEAKSIIKKGNLTYAQAKNLAKPGTVESLSYDAAHGVVSASCAFGIGTLLNYAALRVNGKSREDAIKQSAIEGVRTGVGVFCTSVIAGQLSKTGVMNAFKPSSEALADALGDDFCELLLKSYGQKVIAAEGESVAETATKQAARLLRSEVLVAVVTTIVFSVPDAVDMFRGRISKKQFVKNFAITATTVAAGTVGYGAGAIVSSLLVPGVGTIPAGIVGSILFGTIGGVAADKIADYVTDDDADEMYDILEKKYVQLCEDYMVNEKEAGEIAKNFGDELNKNKDMFKDMYQCKDKEKYADDVLTPLFEEEVAKRPHIDLPSEEEMRASLKEEMKGVFFIH